MPNKSTLILALKGGVYILGVITVGKKFCLKGRCCSKGGKDEKVSF